MLQQGSQAEYWRKSPVPVRMQMHRSSWPRNSCPHIPSRTTWTSASRNNPGMLNPALREEDVQIAWGPSSPIFTGFLPFTPAALLYLARGIPQPMLLCSSPRKWHKLYLFWYIAVGSFNLCNRLREDFIQWGESNYCFICNQLPSQGLNLSEMEGPVSPCTCLDSFYETGLCLW